MSWRSVAHILGLYRVYEYLLEQEVKRGDIPKHVAFILDGNRRWARVRRFPPWFGHRHGAEKAEEVLDWCYDLGVKTVTLFVLSTENLKKRSEEEIREIFKVLEEKLVKLRDSGEIEKRKVHVRFIGDKSLLPSSVREKIEDIERKSSVYSERFLNIAIAYGGRWEIVEAVRRLVKDVKTGKLDEDEISEEVFARYLLTGDQPHPDPDLVIRTSGEERISNFLLWQIAYSELVFLDVYWPDFRKIDLLRAIRIYQSRHRRFGG
ncbi:MAG: polyprenyl diphosphate synthase [Infirmifilum sp.]|jgi:tritrans,polycis-undecaprenyl-diphosphate synthase [geranylgeranyl-diphosphate specific]|uniref:Tritrans,polycis-undecaprenyl-diphosphate synthase (geranylgeranyl-diphosphate specific) n=1 Tax=Infirmifilum uzonense TaxID=1550241 RepID=A0A0F7CL62_9CREN|nr:polyprenyl diphosphate synthase [Infirmifilum uzonense]AKG38856.1 UDP diphosphate synthase [Infirmifilum uzonense]